MNAVAKTVSNLECAIWEALEQVKDPEIPVISVVDLGMITHLDIKNENTVCITMTPTFAACPAIQLLKNSIKNQVEGQVKDLGIENVTVEISYDVQWTSDRITDKGRQQLKEFGLAPPPKEKGEITMEILKNVECPYCDSNETTMKTSFGSTLCRSMHYCNNCKQPFEQFKPI